MNCTDSFARSTCHGTTGSDCTSQRLFPSSDTDGDAMSFMDATVHITVHMITGMQSALDSGPNSSPRTAMKVPPFIRNTAPSTGRRSTPRPQLSI